MGIRIEDKVRTKLKREGTIKELIIEVCEFSDPINYNVYIDVDYTTNQIFVKGKDEDISVMGADTIMAIILAINTLKHLEEIGCLVIVELNKKDHIKLGNEILDGQTYVVKNQLILDYLNKNYILTNEYDKYKERGYLTQQEFYQKEQQETSRKQMNIAEQSLITSKKQMWLAILASILTIISCFFEIAGNFCFC